jgi:integrase
MRDPFSSQPENKIRKIEENGGITTRNREILRKFHDDCFSFGLTAKRIAKYLNYLSKMAELLQKDFDQADADDLKRLVTEIEKMDWADWTKYDNKVMLKKFYKWLEGDNEEYPKKIRWLKPVLKQCQRRLPEGLLSPEDVQKMMSVSSSLRDRALVSVLYESGCRIGELMSMRIRHVEFDDHGSVIIVSGKTGSRRVRLVTSTPYLSNWVAHHPRKGETDAPIWVCTGTTNHKKQLTYNSIRKILMELAEKAGIKKKVNPHSFRHSKATAFANKLTESQMKEYFGWTQASKMAAVYVHLSGRDVDNAILEIHGLANGENKKADAALEPKKCPRCERMCEPDANLCARCGLPLDLNTAIDHEKKANDLKRLLSDPDILERLIEKKVEEILSRRS